MFAFATRPAADANSSVRPTLEFVPVSQRTIFALDLGSITGWATKRIGRPITSGTMGFKAGRFEGGGMPFLRFRRWLAEIESAEGALAVFFEEVRAHAGTTAAHVYGGFLAELTAWCEERRHPYEGVPVATIKRFVTGRGNADKLAVMAAVRARGFAPADDNEADALALLLWAITTRERGMTRLRLPDRRPSVTTQLVYETNVYSVTLGFDIANDRIGEVFTHGAKVGSGMDRLLDDACVALSLLLQHGVEPAALSSSMGRLGDGKSPASIVGALADLIARETSP